MRFRYCLFILLVILLMVQNVIAVLPKGCNNCWLKLGRLTENLILPIREKREKKAFVVDLKAITSAIDRSGLEERVSIELYYEEKPFAVEFSYFPSKNQKKKSDDIVSYLKIYQKYSDQIRVAVQEADPDKLKEGLFVVKDSAGKRKMIRKVYLKYTR